MRKSFYYILIAMLLMSHSAMAARTWRGATRNVHHVAMWGGVGYSGLVNNYDYSRFVGGGGGLLGVGYEYRYDHFILNAGPEFRIFSSMDKVSFPAPYDVAMMGPGYSQTKHYTFGDPLRENHSIGQVMLPIMVGGRWDKWYFLVGAKIGYSLFGTYSQKGTYSTSITDEDAYDPNWSNIPTHDMVSDVPYRANGRSNYGLDVAVTAEVGLNIHDFMSKEWREENANRKHPWHLRLAAFVDYGVMNLTLPKAGAMAWADEQNIYTRSLQTSDWAKGRLNSLMVGVKFTALLQMNKPQPPKPQRPYLILDVTDSVTNMPVVSALVEITQTAAVKKPRTVKPTTNANGRAKAKLAPGTYHMQLSHPNYNTLQHEYIHPDYGDTIMLAMQPRPDFRFYVRDAKSDSLLAAQVTFINAANEATIAAVATDSITGYAQLRLPLKTAIRIHIEAANHMATTKAIEDIGGEETYYLEPIIQKRAIILHNLFFASNQTIILPESEPALQDLYTMLEENPEVRIRITGHTDNIGTIKYNQRLSEGRANSVRDDLINRGIDADRIETEGKGELQPITTNATDEGRAQNRRVEFMILVNEDAEE